MQEDKPSTTATIVAAARAKANRNPTVRGFSDPVAEQFLPRDQPDTRPTRRGLSDLLASAVRSAANRSIDLRAHLMALRTVAIDKGLGEVSGEVDQVVLLGAGLDSRAWRMDALSDATVFELDHPATQRFKRERAASLAPHAAEVRFVQVNFERDSLDAVLAEAGHDPERPTVWIWEGVTMYLEDAAIDATLGIINERSAPGSRLLVTYMSPSLQKKVLGVIVGFLGEPFRSFFTPEQMRQRLESYGCKVARDEGSADWHAQWAIPEFQPRVENSERLATVDWPRRTHSG